MSSDLLPERPQAPVSREPVTIPADVPVVGATLAPGTAPAPVAPQRASHVNASKLASENVVVAAPLSFAGSAARIWKLTGVSANPAARIGLGSAAVLLIACAWFLVLCWYMTWGLLLVPYRLIRRGQRNRKRQALQHRELLTAVGQRQE